jgi:hypothetical protein
LKINSFMVIQISPAPRIMISLKKCFWSTCLSLEIDSTCDASGGKF